MTDLTSSVSEMFERHSSRLIKKTDYNSILTTLCHTCADRNSDETICVMVRLGKYHNKFYNVIIVLFTICIPKDILVLIVDI